MTMEIYHKVNSFRSHGNYCALTRMHLISTDQFGWSSSFVGYRGTVKGTELVTD